LEPGEEVREIFMGQSRYSPIWLLPLLAAWGAAVSAAGVAAAGPALLTLILFGIVTKKRLIVVTDRCAYLLSKKVGSYQVKAVLQKERLGEVMADCGFTWSLRLGEGPPVYATFDSGVGVRKRAAALVNQPL
jgi:hypothetical protein